MTKSRGKGPKGQDALNEIETRLTGLFGAIGEALSEAAARAGDASSQTDQTWQQQWDTGDGPIRASGGVRIRTAADAARARKPDERDPAEPINRRAGGKARPADDPAPEATRKVAFETLEDDTTWRALAQFPGVAASEVRLDIDDGTARLSSTGPRTFVAETPLPGGIDAANISLTVSNGIVELRAEKPKPTAPSGPEDTE